MRRVLAALIVIIGLTASRADALTIRDIIELSKAGLGDEVLLALIEVDRSVFSIDTDTLKKLKAAGVSQPVIVAMVRSGRTPRPEPLPQTPPVDMTAMPDPMLVAPPPAPQVIVIDHHDAVDVPIAVPVAVPVFVSPVRQRRVPVNSTIGVPTMGVGGNLIVNPAVRATGSNNLSPRNSNLSPRNN